MFVMHVIRHFEAGTFLDDINSYIVVSALMPLICVMRHLVISELIQH